MRITYFAAASRDGFIARQDGDVAWLDECSVDTNTSDLEEFFCSVDALVMGRKTYDFVYDYGSWPYEDKPTWVCTHRELRPLEGARLIIVNQVDDVVRGARARGIGHLWLVGGGQLASAFLSKGLLTHLCISEMPIHLGHGIPLFAEHRLDAIPYERRSVKTTGGLRQLEFVLQ